MFKIIFVLVFAFSTQAFALDDVSNFEKWSFGIDFHGVGSQTGENLSLYTPRWGYGQLRLSVGDNFKPGNNGQSDIAYSTTQLELLLFQRIKPESPIRPYLGVSYDLFFSGSSTIGGSHGGYSIFPGVQFWQKIERAAWSPRNVAFFIEGGPSSSNFYSDASTGGQRLGDGFIMKLGIVGDF